MRIINDYMMHISKFCHIKTIAKLAFALCFESEIIISLYITLTFYNVK